MKGVARFSLPATLSTFPLLRRLLGFVGLAVRGLRLLGHPHLGALQAIVLVLAAIGAKIPEAANGDTLHTRQRHVPLHNTQRSPSLVPPALLTASTTSVILIKLLIFSEVNCVTSAHFKGVMI